MKDVMIDIETLGNGPMAVMIQFGAVYFDRHTGETGKQVFFNVDADSCVELGFEMDSSTVFWWLQQSPEARQSITTQKTNRLDIHNAMHVINDFLKEAE